MNISTEQRPLVLITNDDGVSYPGIHFLAEIVQEYADVVVVAPDGSYSGKSHSITVMDELRVRKCDGFFGNATAFAVKGTPVDCVKLGIFGLVPRRPNLVLSGINHGSNSSVSVHYSGTVGAAREGALVGIPSCAISFDNYSEDADFSQAREAVDLLVRSLLDGRLPKTDFYNVNIPQGPIKGLALCRMTMGWWNEKPIMFQPPFGPDAIYWLDGKFVNKDNEASDTDEAIMAKGYVAVTPIKLDVTDYDALQSPVVINL